MEYKIVIPERQGSIAILRFNRPEKRNAVNDRMIDELGHWFENAPEWAKAVILTGEGDHFCSGLDLSEHKERSAIESMQHSQYWHKILNLVQFGVRPVLAAMHGGAIGGGLEIATACNVRVADETSFYQLPEGRRAIFVGGGAAVRVGRIIGADRMCEMMLTGRKYDAQDGNRLGLSHYVVDKGKSLEKALELAEQVIGNAPVSNYMMMNALARINDMSMTDGFFSESIAAALAVTSDEAKQGLDAFLNKKEIRFDK